MSKKEYEENGFIETQEIASIVSIIKKSSEDYGEKSAYRYYCENKIKELSYKNLFRYTELFASWIYSVKCNRSKIALLGPLSCDWMIGYAGIVYSGAVAVVLDPNMTNEQLVSKINKTEVTVILYDVGHSDKANQIKELCDSLKFVVSINGRCSDTEISMLDVITQTTALKIQEPDPDEVCTIVFTSGTTGESKGVMLSQKNICSSIRGGLSQVIFSSEDVAFSVLPINHLYELTCGNLLLLYCGATICINDSLRNIIRNLKVFQPSLMFVVPLILSSFKKQLSFVNGQSAALQGGDSYVSDFFGGRLKKMIVGGAHLDESMIHYFNQYDIEILQGYGISECSPLVCVNSDYMKKANSVGKVVKDCEVRIINNEICVRGSNVMKGYFNDIEATKEAFYGEWFRTGDIGSIDEDNFVYISGRKKRLIILENGENVSPEELELRLYKLPYIAETVVSAQKVNGIMLISAEIYPDPNAIVERGIKNVEESICNEIKEENHMLPRFKRIEQIEFRDKPFEKTSSNKIVIKKYE